MCFLSKTNWGLGALLAIGVEICSTATVTYSSTVLMFAVCSFCVAEVADFFVAGGAAINVAGAVFLLQGVQQLMLQVQWLVLCGF